MAVINLTEARIRDLEPSSGIWRDEQVKGLMVICHATTKTYAVQGDVRRNGRHVRTVRVKIDRADRIGLREARNKAKAIMSQIQSGIDPTARPEESGITVAEALEIHLGEKTFRNATIEAYRYNIEHYLSRYKKRAVTDLSRSEVRDIYDRLRERNGQTTASGVMRTLRAVINTAMRMDETIVSNPVVAIRIPVPKRREVDGLDLEAWWALTEELPPIRRDVHRAMLLTGAPQVIHSSGTPQRRGFRQRRVDLQSYEDRWPDAVSYGDMAHKYDQEPIGARHTLEQSMALALSNE